MYFTFFSAINIATDDIFKIFPCSKYTAQQKFSTDFNTMSHFEWTWTILFNVINMYGDLEIYIFSFPPDKKLSG